jgi:hypothetical protein
MKIEIENPDTLYDTTLAEPMLEFYDNIVTQQHVDMIDAYKLSDEEVISLCNDIVEELMNVDRKYARYIGRPVITPHIHTYTYDSYPEPFHAPENGYVVNVCLAKSWSKNWGGEFITFHSTEPEDIVASYPGRIFVSHGTPWCKISQPNIKAEDDLIYLSFRLV